MDRIESFSYIWRGILMGAADIIPGVSGGTVALILGIYERLVTALSHVDTQFTKYILAGEFKKAAEHLDLYFLICLGIGIITGVGGLASLMHVLLEQYQTHTLAAFFGLILSSSLLVGRMVNKWSLASTFGCVAAALFAFWLVALLPQQPPQSLAYIFFCGFIAICAMILPGISGAFVLLLLGKYHDVTGILRAILHGDLSSNNLLIVVVFVLGCVSGLLAFSKLLRILLSRYPQFTLAVLCGFMVGSLRKIWPFKTDLTPHVAEFKFKIFENIWPDFSTRSLLAIGVMIFSFTFVIVLDKLSREPGKHLQMKSNHSS